MKIKNLSTPGRILFALPFGIFGLNHFLMTDYFIGMLNSFIPGKEYTILLTGALLVACSVCIIINKYVQWCCYILASLLTVFIIFIHIPGLFYSGLKEELAFFALLKDAGLLGGALVIAAFYQKEENVQHKN